VALGSSWRFHNGDPKALVRLDCALDTERNPDRSTRASDSLTVAWSLGACAGATTTRHSSRGDLG
jgi:hypothetical protein